MADEPSPVPMAGLEIDLMPPDQIVQDHASAPSTDCARSFAADAWRIAPASGAAFRQAMTVSITERVSRGSPPDTLSSSSVLPGVSFPPGKTATTTYIMD